MWAIQPGAAHARQDLPSGSVFTPASIAGLAAWFQADTLVLNNNDPVQTWQDSSVNGRNATQATGGFRPLYKTNQINGKPAVLFDGIDDYLATATFTLNQPLTIFAVVKLAATTGGGYFFDGSTNGMCSLRQNLAGNARMNSGVEGPTVVVGTTAHLLTCGYNGASSTLGLDGAADVTGDVGANNMGQISLGVRGNKAGGWSNVLFCEFIAYSGVLSGANQALVKAYLNTKYALF